jgi:3-deoxy-D-manno-octulosonate 8-phosphate phosphatase (KDO 8-P phosphatase)
MTETNSAKGGLERIRAVALDVDGVLTDGGLWWGPGGEEWKRFCFADIMGVSLARRAGLKLALISGEDSPLVDRYAQKMHIQHVIKGCRNKAAALREFAAAAGIELAEICFMGDDVNDLPAMQIAGFSAAPANAAQDVLAKADFIAKCAGGNGAVRELMEALLAARGLSAPEVFTSA